MNKSLFAVPKMDCPSEERMVRLALEGTPHLRNLSFDFARREVEVFHTDDVGEITQKLTALGLGASFIRTESADDSVVAQPPTHASQTEARTLWILLAINGVMFVTEFGIGIFARSTGLVADSLDMFADAAVYGLSLYAVGKSISHQIRAAHISGWFQLALALGVLVEVGRRFWRGGEPLSDLMIGMGLLALLANITCLYLISGHRKGGAHMKASWIFSTNDVLANIGVMVAGALVAWTGSPYPDLIIGTIIAGIVLSGAHRILKLKH